MKLFLMCVIVKTALNLHKYISSSFSYITCTLILLFVFFSVISHFLQQFLHGFFIFFMIFSILLPHLVDNKLGNLWRNKIKFGEEKEVAPFLNYGNNYLYVLNVERSKGFGHFIRLCYFTCTIH